MKRELKEDVFIMRFDKTTRLNLALLAQEAGKSQAEIVRRLINSTAGKMTQTSFGQAPKAQPESAGQ